MRTLDKVFACIWAALALFTFVAAIVADARHQFALTGLSAFMALMMWPWNERNETN